MKFLRPGALALGLWCAWGNASALESYLLYDNFTGGTLDRARWMDAERTRSVLGNTLRMAQRDWGLTTSDSGSNLVTFTESIGRGGPVTQLRAHVRVTAIDQTACAANATSGTVKARIMGTFFNTGNRTYGSNLGDVVVQIYALRRTDSVDAPGVLRVEAGMWMCTAADCYQSTQLGSTLSLGTVNLGTATLLQIDWDRAGKQFLFSRDKAAATALSYTVDDSADPGAPFKSVGTQTNVASCASGPRAYGFIDAKFDNVQVNTSAKP